MKRLKLAIVTMLALSTGAFATSDIGSVARQAQQFEKQFVQGLNSSTIAFDERSGYKALVNRLEESLDAAARSATSAEARKKLVDAMEAAVEIDHFMANSRWTPQATAQWQQLRSDLNSLAEQHELPRLSHNLRTWD